MRVVSSLNKVSPLVVVEAVTEKFKNILTPNVNKRRRVWEKENPEHHFDNHNNINGEDVASTSGVLTSFNNNIITDNHLSNIIIISACSGITECILQPFNNIINIFNEQMKHNATQGAMRDMYSSINFNRNNMMNGTLSISLSILLLLFLSIYLYFSNLYRHTYTYPRSLSISLFFTHSLSLFYSFSLSLSLSFAVSKSATSSSQAINEVYGFIFSLSLSLFLKLLMWYMYICMCVCIDVMYIYIYIYVEIYIHTYI